MSDNWNLFTVNVIEMSYDDILQLVAFPETPEGNENAEKLFRAMVLENYSDISTDDLDSYVEDGMFHKDSFSVLLVHST